MNRRDFIKSSALAGGALAGGTTAAAIPAAAGAETSFPAATAVAAPPSALPDLRPAKWVWYPSERCLQNTFVLFRRELTLAAKPRRATGWICADSRYRLHLNGRRLQWGPAPCDPRWQEADPLDLTDALQPGRNVLAATVVFFGQGDGTWPLGKPGFLFWLEIEHADGRKERVASDTSWQTLLCRAWSPGHYKRWYLRALQEEFDARLYPYGWDSTGFQPDANWLPAMELGGSPNRPSVCTSYYEYQTDLHADPADTELRPRRLPLMRESRVPVKQLTETARLEWLRPPQEYFECRVPKAFGAERNVGVAQSAPGVWTFSLDGRRGQVLTFEFAEQVVGWPFFTVDASEGTVLEMLVHEAHQPGGPVLLNSHFDSWTRFTCRAGENHFESFDFESLRWLQLHVHGPAGEVRVRELGVRRRVFPWPNTARVRVGEPALQRLMEATVNTLHNCAQETLVDGMARERQQYSGDCGHQTHAIYLAFGETRLPARYLSTFSQGLTLDGYFLDCWPAYDRLARLMERQMRLTGWGPILDHGVQFFLDCWHHYLYTGDLAAVREPYPRLLKFAAYLLGIRQANGLLPVENLGIPSVWIDHVAYRRQRHKQCAFNLYTAAALEHGLAPLAGALGDQKQQRAALELGRSLREAAVQHFWSADRGVFVNNLPWLAEEKTVRLCDRSLANAILFDQCPGHRTGATLKALAECPPEMGFSYPANAGWRLWALAQGGRADVVLKDLRERWAPMPSVQLNNTLQEDWTAAPDSHSQWSHCAVAPLYILYMSILGLRPLAPGFRRCEFRPQLANLEQLDLTACTVRGPIDFTARGPLGGREITLALPPGCEAELVVPQGETLSLKPAAGQSPPGHRRYALPAGQATFRLTTT